MLTPCLWFDGQAEAAATFWTMIFPDSAVHGALRLPTGQAMTVDFTLAGQRFTGLNGGPRFTINPSISFFFFAADADEAKRVFDALAAGGQVLMPFGEWPWSPAYGWVQDRFGVSWQVMPGSGQRVVPCLMFSGARHGQAEAALNHYVAVLGGEVQGLARYTAEEGHAGTIKHGRAQVGGGALVAMDAPGEHPFGFNEAVSFQVACADQAELDRVWDALVAGGGAESRCGWLQDRFGVSWQILPAQLGTWMTGPRGGAVMQALMPMGKLDIATLEAAAAG